MKTIEIKNLKSIKDSGVIDIKPFTVLIGKNSSGKSTFLRTFPLIKQSTSKKLSSPILWYGDDVDFGSFKNSINDKCNEDDAIMIKIGFSSLNISPKENEIPCFVSFFIKEQYVEKYELIIGDNKIEMVCNSSRDYDIFINGEHEQLWTVGVDNNYYSFFRVTTKTDELSNLMNKYLKDKGKQSNNSLDKSFFEIYVKLIRTIDKTSPFNLNEINESIKKIFGSSEKTNNENLDNIKASFKLVLIEQYINKIGEKITQEFKRIHYFKPIRTRGDRYYRIQGIDVEHVDSDGLNAPMILYSLGANSLEKFKKWCIKNFGFQFLLKNISTNKETASVYVKTREGEEHNLTDVGFGYSQIFPIILSLWLENNNTQMEQIIVIEQPELHLHPAFQKKIIKMLANIINLTKGKFKFIIETHSETIINYIGLLIREEKLSSKMVNLLKVEMIDRESKFEKLEFDSEGLISNWPVGFFTDED